MLALPFLETSSLYGSNLVIYADISFSLFCTCVLLGLNTRSLKWQPNYTLRLTGIQTQTFLILQLCIAAEAGDLLTEPFPQLYMYFVKEAYISLCLC